MVVFEGEYGEGFSGIGYSHPSVPVPVPIPAAAGETAPDPASDSSPTEVGSGIHSGGVPSWGTSSGNDASGTERDSQPMFVAAQRCEGDIDIDNGQASHHHQQQQQQQQIQRDAVLARSKAQDILRNIMSGIDAKNSSSTEIHPTSTEIRNNPTDDDDDDGFGHAGTPNRSYYGPQEGTDPSGTIAPAPSSGEGTAGTAPPGPSRAIIPAPTTPSSSIESEAQVARRRAMGILRRFQSQSTGTEGGGAGGVASSDGRGGARGSSTATPVLSISSHGPQDHHSHSAGTGSHDFFPVSMPVPPQQQQQYTPISSLSQPQLQSMIPPTVVSAAMVPATVVPPTVVPPPEVPTVTTPPWELARRRRECLERDEERKQRAMYKNLRYVARLEEERLAKQLEEVRQVQTLEQQIDESYRRKLEHRQMKRRRGNATDDGSNTINTSGAGIGTKQRRKAEAKRQKAALPPSLQKNRRRAAPNTATNGGSGGGGGSVAIYVSNLPTDGSGEDEKTIEALFAAYGSLRKVHFYVDKRTGRKKGDALVIYSLSEGQDEARLTESVCSQVNGCELPGGTVLRVEPSDPYHKVTAMASKSNPPTTTTTTQQQHQPKSRSPPETVPDGDNPENRCGGGSTPDDNHAPGGTEGEKPPEEPGGGDAEEDLDDFFASLE